MRLAKLRMKFIEVGHPRTIQARKNIIASLGLKGFSLIVSFLLVPLTLNYLNSTKYGIWLTLSSIVGWLGFFDLGLGNGLRNKLTEAFALNDKKLAKTYISTTYAIVTIIVVAFYIIFLSINPFLNWSKILNASPEMANKLSWVAIVVFTFFILRFILKLIGIIFIANQLPAYNNAFDFFGNLISLILIFIITKFTHGSLLYISAIYSAAPVLILIIASFYYFNQKYKIIKPSFKAIDFKYIRPLGHLGVKFFLLQIAVLILFSTDNMIITQVLGPAAVTPYNIAFKFFSIPTMIFTIILTPYWSAFTDAITKNDEKWVRNSIRKLIKIWIGIVFFVFVLLAISKYFYIMWIGRNIQIPFSLSVFMGLFAIISTWNSVFANFLNGAGKIKLQMYGATIMMLINIPLSIFFAKNMAMGSSGVILGTCVCLFLGSILQPIQYFKIINKKDYGLWGK